MIISLKLILAILGISIISANIGGNAPVKSQTSPNIKEPVFHQQISNLLPFFLSPPVSPSTPISYRTDTISVIDLINAKDFYAGKKVSVQGKILIVPRYGLMPCREGELCDPILGVDLYIADSVSKTGWDSGQPVPIYKDGKPYLCTHAGDQTVSCKGFQNGEIRIINGIFVKTQVPYQTVGNSSGQSTVTKWQDFYYLEIE